MCSSSLFRGGLGHGASGATARARVRSSNASACSSSSTCCSGGQLHSATIATRRKGIGLLILANGASTSSATTTASCCWLRATSARSSLAKLGVRCHSQNSGGSGESSASTAVTTTTTTSSVSVREKELGSEAKKERGKAAEGEGTRSNGGGASVVAAGGLPLAEVARRRKISEAMKKKWSDPSYKTKMSSSLRGKGSKAMSEKWKCEDYASKVSKGRSGIEPWNKGRKLSEDHKQRIKEAKMGSSHSKGTRDKMSRSQKKRYAAARVLQSMDMLAQQQHKSLQRAKSTGGGRERNINAMEPTLAEAAGAGSAGAGSVGPGKEPSMDRQRANLLKRYKSILHDFRLVESEIKPWVSQFLSEHGRKPTMADVEATKMDWLIHKYKKYNLMKQQLIIQIPGIRTLKNPQSSQDRRMTTEAKSKDARLSALFTAVSNSNLNSKSNSNRSIDAAVPQSSYSSSERRSRNVSERMSKLETMASKTNNPRMKAALRHVGEYREKVLAQAKKEGNDHQAQGDHSE